MSLLVGLLAFVAFIQGVVLFVLVRKVGKFFEFAEAIMLAVNALNNLAEAQARAMKRLAKLSGAEAALEPRERMN